MSSPTIIRFHSIGDRVATVTTYFTGDKLESVFQVYLVNRTNNCAFIARSSPYSDEGAVVEFEAYLAELD